jgi:RNA polymerase sigma-70 factor (ECF subfamily)
MESDETLYARVRAGDLGAFDRLYQRYERRLFGFILLLVGQRAEAEEVLHDAFLGVLESREVRFTEASFSTWLYRVARNLCLNRLRARRRAAAAEADIEPPAAAPDAAERLERHQLDAALAGAVARLSPALADVYRLRAAGLSYDEISGALDIPVGTVKSRMNQLVHQLQKEVEPWIAEMSAKT